MGCWAILRLVESVKDLVISYVKIYQIYGV